MNPARYALIDGHVHFHACFDPERFLNCARANFACAAAAANVGDHYSAYLLLTETSHDHWFDDLSRRAATGQNAEVAPGWTVRSTADPRQLKLRGPECAELNVVSGYQIVTSENLEVLALGCIERIPDRAPMEKVLATVRAANAIPVVPWGFGKWLGRRGRCVRSLVETATPDQVFLGDNSNRLTGFPEPEIFRRARAAGFRVLPGTDALPFPREAGGAGALGFLLEFDPLIEDADAWSAVHRKIECDDSFRAYGRADSTGPWSFVRNQIAMQLHKRFGAQSSA